MIDYERSAEKEADRWIIKVLQIPTAVNDIDVMSNSFSNSLEAKKLCGIVRLCGYRGERNVMGGSAVNSIATAAEKSAPCAVVIPTTAAGVKAPCSALRGLGRLGGLAGLACLRPTRYII